MSNTSSSEVNELKLVNNSLQKIFYLSIKFDRFGTAKITVRPGGNEPNRNLNTIVGITNKTTYNETFKTCGMRRSTYDDER